MKRILKNLIRSGFRSKWRNFPNRSLSSEYPCLRGIRCRLSDWVTSEVYTVGEHSMCVDLGDSLGLRKNRGYEKHETALVREVVRAGDTVLDIGANIGYYSVLFASLVGDAGCVHAFEPHPDNALLLRKNLDLNGFSQRVRVNQAAVADREGTLKLFCSHLNAGDCRIYGSQKNINAHEVSVLTIDNYLNPSVSSMPKVDFIKMDIQGAEYSALQGMLHCLESQHSLHLLTEYSPQGLKSMGADPKKYLVDLQRLGFKPLSIFMRGERIEISSWNVLEVKLSNTPDEEINLFCRKGE